MQVSDTPPQNIIVPGFESMNTSIPILTCDKVISDNLTWYVLRLTPLDAYEVGAVQKMLQNVIYSEHYIVATELSVKMKLHYHIVFTCDLVIEKTRGLIKDWLSQMFPGPWKKEDGNKRYNLDVSTNYIQAFKYLLKMKGVQYICSDNINPEFIADCKKKSFEKYSKEAFTIQFEKLKSDFREDIIDYRQLRVKIIQLKGLYSQPICLRRIDEIVLSCRINKDPSLAEDL